MSIYKIIIYPVPLSGHINPLLPIIKELIDKNKNLHIIVFTSDVYKRGIEAAGAEFRSVDLSAVINLTNNVKPLNKKRDFQLFQVISSFLNMPNTPNIVKNMAKEIVQEEPNLILYDILNPLMRWTVRYYNKWYKIANKTSQAERTKLSFCPNKPLPTLIAYSTSFATKIGLYPNSVENSQICSISFRFIWDIFFLFITYTMFSFKIGVEIVNPLNDISDPIENTELIMTTVFPDLQPRSHLFDEKIWKFIGSTINDHNNISMTNSLVKEKTFQEILNKFEVVENKSNILENEHKEFLIYVSLGTLFNNNLVIYKTILDALKSFDSEPCNQSRIKLNNLKILVSTGEKVYDQFKSLIDKNLYSLPDNIELVKIAPQIEILKRASLFVTHCGLNSTSETIHYGVPMICIPLVDDQPLVAYRVADELGLGIRLDFITMNSNDVRKAFHKILNDKSYYERMDRYSKLSRNHLGFSNGAKLIIEHLRMNK